MDTSIKVIKTENRIRDIYCGCCNRWLGIDGWYFKFCPFCGIKFEGEGRSFDVKSKHNTAQKAKN